MSKATLRVPKLQSHKTINKRYSIIDKQIARHFCKTVNVFQTPLPFYATHMINPFPNSRISAKYDKG